MSDDDIERLARERGQQAYDEALRDGMSVDETEELRRLVEQDMRDREEHIRAKIEKEARGRERIAKALHARGRHYYGDKDPGDSVH